MIVASEHLENYTFEQMGRVRYCHKCKSLHLTQPFVLLNFSLRKIRFTVESRETFPVFSDNLIFISLFSSMKTDAHFSAEECFSELGLRPQ